MPTDLAMALQRRAIAEYDEMTATIAVLLVLPLAMCVFTILVAVENPAFARCIAMLG